MDGLDVFGQRLVGRRARAGRGAALLPVVVAAGGDFQILAKRKDGVIAFHRVDPFIALGDGSERMPNVFF
jgi:hypothetical protein